MPLTLEMLKRLWPHGNQHVPGLMEGIAGQAPTVFPHFGIDTDLEVAYFMAMVSEEIGAGAEPIESMNYSEQGLINTWPTRFGRTRARKFAHNPQMIAEAVYGGRDGNAPAPSNDGWLYRGHGLTQLTFRENYERVGKQLGLDLVGDPDLCNAPEHALSIGCQDFINCTYEDKNCLQWAHEDNIIGCTHALNGGLIGLDDRRTWLRHWKAALGV